KGSLERASIHTENAVLALPELDSHGYLMRRDLPASLLEAAVRGFEEASGRRSLIMAARIECDAGRLMAKHGRDREAIRYFGRALEIMPNLYAAEAHSGTAYYRLDEYREAIEHFRRATAILPRRVWPHFYMGQSHRALGEHEEAIAAFRRARERNPRELRFFYALGEVLEDLGRTEEAERQFRAAANVNATRPDAWSKLLAFYVRQGDRRKAIAICERMQKEDIDNARDSSECAILMENVR
ncbi:MAG: tetratricopeptide repeat protein, partial [Pseudomonadales bacterium]